MSVLVCENLTKKTNKEDVIKNFNFNFLDNQIYALIGKHTSGKDTLLGLLTAKIKPTEGVVYLDGEMLFNNNEMSKRICYVSKSTSFPSHMKINNILKLMNEVYPKWDNAYAIKLCDYFNINIAKTYGMLDDSRKSLFINILGIACRANITIFNDPVNSVDPKDRFDFFDFLYNHHQGYPRTIILTTDFIDEISHIVDKILLFDKGRLIDCFTVDEIRNNFCYLSGKTEVLKSLLTGVKIIGVEDRGKNLTVCIRKTLSKDDIRKYQKYLIKISDVPIQKVFIYLINLRERKGK